MSLLPFRAGTRWAKKIQRILTPPLETECIELLDMLGTNFSKALGKALMHDPKPQRFVLRPMRWNILSPVTRNKTVAEAALEGLRLGKSPVPLLFVIQSLH